MPQPTIQQRKALTHSPQPLSPVMFHKWMDLLFLHWSFDPDEIQRTLPPGLTVDTFDPQAYVAIVPFFMHDVRPRFFPSLPYISHFLELNLRTYVHDDQGNAGVWFYSLDANRWLAVEVARKAFNLPYFRASMKAAKDRKTGEIRFFHLRDGVEPGKGSVFRYRGVGDVFRAEPGSLEFFLVERYLLFARRRGKLSKGRVHHPPYPLMSAEAPEWDDQLFELDGLKRPEKLPEHVLYSPGVDVAVYRLES